MTAQRIGEVVGIAQSELDLNEAAPVWTMPRQRAKNGQPNRVPLSPVAVRLIKEAQEFGGGGAWLFPSPAFAGRASFAIIGEYYDAANSDADPEPAGLRRHCGAHPATACGCPSPADA